MHNDLPKIYCFIDEYNKALELDHELWIAYMNRGRSYYRLEHYELARLDYEESIKINPNNDKLKLWINELP